MSSLFALVEVHADGMRVVWGGRPERLSKIDLAMPPHPAPDRVASTETAPPAVDPASLSEHLKDETQKRLAAETALTAECSAHDDDRRALQTTTKKLAITTSALEAAQQALNAMQSELKLQSQPHANAQQQLQTARIGANKLVESLLSKSKAYNEATEQRQAAETRAIDAEQARDALVAELADLRRPLGDQVDPNADALPHAHAQLDAERQRQSDAACLATALARQLEAQNLEFAQRHHAAAAEVLETRNRLAEAQKELDDRRLAQADDDAHIRGLIETHRFSELLSFVVTRILGVPVKDGDEALAFLEQHHHLASRQPAPTLTVSEQPSSVTHPSPPLRLRSTPQTATRFAPRSDATTRAPAARARS